MTFLELLTLELSLISNLKDFQLELGKSHLMRRPGSSLQVIQTSYPTQIIVPKSYEIFLHTYKTFLGLLKKLLETSDEI